MKNTVIYSTLAAAIAVSAQMSADTGKAEELIVTGTRTEVAMKDLLASAHVFTEEDIKRSFAMGLAELISTLPGVNFDESGGRGSNSALRFRGTEGDHVLVLIDGVRSASASSGSTSFQHIPLSQVERIEVVQGPRASLYGSEAIGGVIQIFTKKGTSETKPYIGIEAGSHNTQKTTAGIRGTFGETRYSIGAAYERTDGIDRTVSNNGADADKDAYRESSFSAAFDRRFDTGLNIGLSLLRSDGNAQFDASSPDDSTDFLNDKASIFINYPISESINIKTEIGYFKDRRKTFGTNPSLFETKRTSALVQADVKLNEDQIFTIGFDYYLDKLNPDAGFVERSRDNNAVFVQYQGSYDQISVVASWREDDNEAFGNYDTGSISFGYQLAENTLVSFSYGEAFKAPTFNDLYFPFTEFEDTGFGASTFVGDLNIVPEESETYEVLIKSSISNVDWSLSFYETKIKDLITFVGVFNLSTFVFDGTVKNVESVEIEGVEFEASTRTENWSFNFSANYQEPRNEDTDDILDRRTLASANVSVTRYFNQFDLGAAWTLNGHRFDFGDKVAGYGTLDLFGHYQIASNFDLSFRVANVFDQNYQLSNRFETEGTTAYMSANYTF